LLASHRRVQDLIPIQTVWDFWWTEWHWDRFFSKYFGVLLLDAYLLINLQC